jgi:hypothetical protein
MIPLGLLTLIILAFLSFCLGLIVGSEKLAWGSIVVMFIFGAASMLSLLVLAWQNVLGYGP